MELLQPLTPSNLQPFIENPARLANQPVAFQIAIASYPETPRPLLEVLANNPDLATVLSEYAQSDNAFVRLVALLHPLTPEDVLEQGARSQSWLGTLRDCR